MGPADFAGPLLGGLAMFLDPTVLLLGLIGAIWGMIAGALPGMGSVVAVGIALPFTLVLDPVYAVVLVVAISTATGFGNSVPAVVVGVPGSPSAFLTAIDGYALHLQGKSGLALGVAFFSTVAGQWLAIILFALMIVPLGQLTWYFHGPEFFALFALGMTAVVSLTGKNVYKGLAAAGFGVLVSMVGRDPINFAPRLTFGFVELRQGFSTSAVIIGVLACSELIRQMRQTFDWSALQSKFDRTFPRWSVLRSTLPMVVSGTFVGTFIGAIPGLGSTPATMMSYQQARMYAKHPEDFGKGSVEGIAANEAAGSSANAGELVPTLALGIPGSGTMAILLTALVAHGLAPGPRLLVATPELVDATVAGLFVVTVCMALTGWFMARALLRLALANRSVVLVVSFMLTTVGIYGINRRAFDVYVMLIFAAVGYFGWRYGYSPAAIALGVILGGGFEQHLRQGILLVGGDWARFFFRPYTATILALASIMLLYGIYSTWTVNKRERESEEGETKMGYTQTFGD